MFALVSWSDIALKGDNLIDRRMQRPHAEYLFDLVLLTPNGLVALSWDEDNAMDFLKEMVVPVRVPIGSLGVAKVGGGVQFLANFEWVFSAAKCSVIDSELSNWKLGWWVNDIQKSD